jgi:serine/threonine protein kinase
MPLSEVQLVLRQVVEGLVALHAKGVVHRDLKPGNLLVGQDGGVKVADFGLAKQVGGEQSTFLTRTGTFAGTMHYMAPEQAEGMDITPATDLYALGVIWYELLTGRRPSGKFKLAKLRPDCPGRWTSLIEDCLDDEPEDRPSLDRIQQALQSVHFEAVNPPTGIEQEETPPPPVTEPETPQEQLPREELEPESVIEFEEPEPEAWKEDPLPEYEGGVGETAKPTKVKAAVGLKLWEFETGHWVTSSPAIGSDGTVYVGSYDNKLYAIKTDSKGPAKSPWPMRGQNARHTGRVMKK